MSIWRPLETIFGGILGAFWGPFGHILGVRSALGRKCLIKGGVDFWEAAIFINFLKKKANLGIRKREPNRSQDGTGKGRKKGHLEN